ncbi:hypothetical protein BDV95DRAFT_599567 [Massariosphaeria phaeospora]|uniref:Uncharacterized protein n=1 Tax=Massariosphaeria phaeospora TaxID=100035 RepID=A0A7C8MF44_9PLEO|nr:hypothetical protein BDV95DRAFT_599567 [Massariosphaeria phaeospora]
MPKAPKIRSDNRRKRIGIQYNKDFFNITISARDTSDQILTQIRAALNTSQPLIFTNANSIPVRMNYTELKAKSIIWAFHGAPPAPATFNAGNKLQAIVARWDLQSTEDIFPADIAPRENKTSVRKARMDEVTPVLEPAAWSRSFVKALDNVSFRVPRSALC